VGPPFFAIFETSTSSSSLEDLDCKFYVLTSVPALAPVLHTTGRKSQNRMISSKQRLSWSVFT